MRFCVLTYRFRFHGVTRFQRYALAGGVIVPFWHNRILGGMICPIFKNYRSLAVISDHFDGELITRIAALFGHGAARGSTGKRSFAAIRETARALQHGWLIGITPDGPQGPVYHLQEGAAYLAEISRKPVIPLLTIARWRIRFPSWDRFEFPLPFSRVDFHFGRAVTAHRNIEKTLLAVQAEMHRQLRLEERFRSHCFRSVIFLSFRLLSPLLLWKTFLPFS